jgi:hypothetical protein
VTRSGHTSVCLLMAADNSTLPQSHVTARCSHVSTCFAISLARTVIPQSSCSHVLTQLLCRCSSLSARFTSMWHNLPVSSMAWSGTCSRWMQYTALVTGGSRELALFLPYMDMGHSSLAWRRRSPTVVSLPHPSLRHRMCMRLIMVSSSGSAGCSLHTCCNHQTSNRLRPRQLSGDGARLTSVRQGRPAEGAAEWSIPRRFLDLVDAFRVHTVYAGHQLHRPFHEAQADRALAVAQLFRVLGRPEAPHSGCRRTCPARRLRPPPS